MQARLPKPLSAKLENLPTRPGVYMFKDRRGRIVYVGKAKKLRTRVRSYFGASRVADPKLRRLVSRTADVTTIVTDSEVEALVLEANLIKEYKPRYNVNLKDDKSYPYVRVTNELFPRVFATRRVVRDGSRYFGPFTDVGALHDLLNTVQKIFPIRSCNLKLTPESIAKGKFKVCLDYHIQRCLGPCEGHVDDKKYREIVGYVVDFIEGRDTHLVDQLKHRMKESSEQLRYEEAARMRDVLKAVEAFKNRQKVVSTDLVDRDIVTVAVDVTDACAVVFKVREGRVVGRQDFHLTRALDEGELAMLGAFLKQYYLRTDFIPSEILAPQPLPEQRQMESWLAQKSRRDVRIRVPNGEDEQRLLSMCQRNASLSLQEIKLQRLSSEKYLVKSIEALQTDLSLPTSPRHIEAFDVSNIQGRDATASVVCFVNGKPAKANYRHFRIRVKETPDDFAMMSEAVGRHFSRVLREGRPLPDLVLIDGGKGQISAALEAMRKAGIQDLPIIGLAKRLDEVYVPGISDPQNLPKNSASLRLLQRIRDESHRFAVAYHRKLRGRRALESELQQIPGVGEKRHKALLKAFGSLRKIAEVSVDDLASVEGVTRAVAERTWEYFHRDVGGKMRKIEKRTATESTELA